MPQIIVTTDHGAAFGEGAVTLRERVCVADFESQHFATQLVERLGWAVEDADHEEQVSGPADSPADPNDRRHGVSDRRREVFDRRQHVSERAEDEATMVEQVPV
jgi:hypothetical protein